MDREKEYSYTFTIFIPTYNRAHLLPRALESIAIQTYKDFEVIIVDDGSTDDTKKIVQEWIEKEIFPIRYFYQENKGKPSAHNRAVKEAKGYFFVTLDSDDILAPDALEILKRAWDEIPKERRHYFAGVEGNCQTLTEKKIFGSYFPNNILECSFLEMRYKYKVKGDKKGMVLTDILRKYPFPTFDGEKFIRESLIWCRISQKYIFKYINKTIQYVEQQANGITRKHNFFKLRSPKGLSLCFLEIVNEYYEYFNQIELYKYMVRYIKYSFLSNRYLFCQYKKLKRHKLMWIIAIPEAYIKYVKDKIKLSLQST